MNPEPRTQKPEIRRSERTRRVALLLISGFWVLGSGFISSCHQPAPSIHDDLGRAVALPPRISRAVTLAPNLTELMFAAGAGEKVVCADDFSDYPAAATKLPKVGGLEPNIEKIVACRPDVVLATTNGNRPNLAPALAAVHIPLYVVRTDRLSDVARVLGEMSALFETADHGQASRRVREQLLQQRRVRSRSPRVLFAVWTNPLYVAGRKTYADDLLSLTGATNVVAVDGWPQYSLESLIATPPDVLLYPEKAVGSAAIEELFNKAPEMGKTTTAIGVDDNLFTRPGPRVPETAAQLNAILDRWSMLHP